MAALLLPTIASASIGSDCSRPGRAARPVDGASPEPRPSRRMRLRKNGVRAASTAVTTPARLAAIQRASWLSSLTPLDIASAVSVPPACFDLRASIDGPHVNDRSGVVPPAVHTVTGRAALKTLARRQRFTGRLPHAGCHLLFPGQDKPVSDVLEEPREADPRPFAQGEHLLARERLGDAGGPV